MIRNLFAALAFTIPLAAIAGLDEMPSRAALASATLSHSFHAPHLAVSGSAVLGALPVEKAAPASTQEPIGPLRVATVRALPEAVQASAWTRADGGFVTRLSASSSGAEGLRVRLDLGAVPGALEVRVQGNDGLVESMIVDPTLGPESWLPYTEGPEQLIEIYSAVLPSPDAVRMGAILHFTQSIYTKAAGACTVSTACAATDATLGSGVAGAIAERKKSVMKLQFIDNGSGFLCTGTLINTEKFPAAFMLTANHCINNEASAQTIITTWFYEASACDGGIAPAPQQIPGGGHLVFTNHNVDSTLVLLNQAPPSAASYAGWSKNLMANGDAIVSISHPAGDTSRYAIGNISQQYRILGYPQDMYGVRFSKGIIQGGSSGSGLFSMSGSSLQLRGVLSGSTIRNSATGMSCTDTNEDALYTRFELLEPEIDPYIRAAAAPAADDAPNRPQDLFSTPLDSAGADMPLNQRANTYARDNLRIDYAGDLDTFRFNVTVPAYVSAWTTGANGANLDTVASILDSAGTNLEANDDAQAGDNYAGITRKLDAGTYYFQVGHFETTGTGTYNIRMRADVVDTNYTDLWWNAAESGWGLNLNHQGNTIFATLFTYDTTGAPMWLAMSNGALQADGSYSGTLYRGRGSAFNASSFSPTALTEVGSMRVAFSTSSTGTVTYTFNGTSVTKSITRMVFATPPSCTWSAFDRSVSDNYQDLWWNPNESGWGLNITHQSNTLFATLFTYDTNGQGLWLVMSAGTRTSTGHYSGTLYRSSGPAFNAVPWPGVTLTPVGTMSLAFTDGNAGTLTYTYNGATVNKTIQREVFGPIKTDCGS